MYALYIGWLVPVFFDKNHPAQAPDPLMVALLFVFIAGVTAVAYYFDRKDRK